MGGLAGLVGAGGFAFQLWPTLDLIRQSTHASIPLRSCGLPFALDWPDLVSIGLAATPFDRFLPWERNAYFGALALILALVGLAQPPTRGARQWRSLLVTALVAGLILGFNPTIPFLPGERRLLPEVSPFRVPARFLMFVGLAGAGLAGMGFEAVLNGARPRWPFYAALALAGLALPADWRHVTAPNSPSSLSVRIFYAAAVSAPRYLASALLVWLMMRGLPRRAGAAAVLCLLYADLWVFGHPYIHWRPGTAMELVAGQRPVAPSEARVVTYPYMFANGSVYSRTANAQGYASIILDTYAEVVEGAGRHEVCNPSPEHVNLAATDTHLLRILSVKHVESFTGPVDTPLQQIDGLDMYASTDYWPRAQWVGRVTLAASYQEAAALARQPDFDPTQVVVIEADESPVPPGTSADTAAAASARFVTYKPQEVAVDVQAPAAGLLVLNDVWYRGWRATVNGSAAPVYRANGAFRAVSVPAGHSTVVFSFRSDALRVGAWVSLAVWALVLASLGVSGMRRRRG